jgi:hypothetical protein
MNDSSRTQGGLICVAVFILAAWFLVGLLQESYWAIALPVAAIVFFVLGLSFWVGYTIATIRVEPFDEGEAVDEDEPAAAAPPSPAAPARDAPGDDSDAPTSA